MATPSLRLPPSPRGDRTIRAAIKRLNSLAWYAVARQRRLSWMHPDTDLPNFLIAFTGTDIARGIRFKRGSNSRSALAGSAASFPHPRAVLQRPSQFKEILM